ncbi:hypothetical protein BROUX41_002419 [Berkeleyomyces rouxiae]|uniref:uncharacterized protein n=1 Tax=Berkeleyomyces rouxiae TaxID=2035830 RepID=UPI003B762351
MAARSISPVSTLSRSSSSPVPQAPPAPPSHMSGKIPEPDISDESDSDTQSQIRHTEPPPPQSQPPLHLSDSDVEDARSAIRVSHQPSSRRASGQGSTHTANHNDPRPPSVAESAAAAPPPAASPPPDDTAASQPAPSIRSRRSISDPNPDSNLDTTPRDHVEPGPPPPPSPPTPSGSVVKLPPPPFITPQSDIDPSEAELRAAKERRARKARARSQTQTRRPPSPPPEPADGAYFDNSRPDREDRKRQKERERDREVDFAKEVRHKPRRERRGSIRERSDREREKERDRSDREKERTRDLGDDRGKMSEDDRVKERHHRRERRNSVRTREKDKGRDLKDLEREEEEERSKERHRRERRGSMRARDKDREAVKAVQRERERERERERDREYGRERDSHGHRRNRTGTRYHDVSDRDEVPVDSRRFLSRDKERDRDHDVRFAAPREKDQDLDRRAAHRDRRSDESDYDRERDRERERERTVPPQAHTTQPNRSLPTRTRRNSQTQPASPQRRQSLTERIRNQWHGLRRDSSLRKSNRNKSPPIASGGNTGVTAAVITGAATAAAATLAASRAESPTRAISRPTSSNGPTTQMPPTSAAPSQMGARSIVAGDAEPGVIGAGAAAAAAAAIANNPRTDPVDRLRAWQEQCDIKHGVHCSGTPTGMAPSPWRPEYVIDCAEFRLVHPRVEDEYVALSYVWGEEEHSILEANKFMTLSSNLDEFCDSLGSAEMCPAFLDALWLVQKMNVRYLWIDKYCIVQDDEAMKEEHVRNMPFLYAHASFTVVIALENVSLGLLALDRKRAAPDSKAVHIDLVFESVWSTRAWTLQEALYSRRCVYIFRDVYSWECHCDTWQSNILALPSAPATTISTKHKILGGSSSAARAKVTAPSALKCTARITPAALAFRHTQWPDMDEFARIVMDYSTRRLTHVQDTQRAFSGITNILSRTFAGGFVFAMPVMFLDIAMLWKPQASIRRRVLPPPSAGSDANGAPSSTGPIPSWSWMGWFFDDVAIDTSIWRAAADYVESTPLPKNRHPGRRYVSQFHFRVRGLVNYTLTDSAAGSGQMATPLLSTGLDRRGQRLRKDSDLPAGWSFTRDNYLRHESDPATRFRYPIPVAPAVGTRESLAGAAVQPPGSLLSFRAERAFLHVQLQSIKPMSRNGLGGPVTGPIPNKLLSNPPVAIGKLVTRSGRYAGTITSHDAWLGIQSSNHDLDVVGGEKLELVAISVSSERGGSAVFGAEVFKEVAGRSDTLTLEYVNVLWIEQVGGIAYRRGLGHVLLSVWEGLQRKDNIDVLLG